jgi:hypothetical protein
LDFDVTDFIEEFNWIPIRRQGTVQRPILSSVERVPLVAKL